ncbi:hypothetical protein V7S43_015914 [Phytophthora oleae]|uniref:Exocyst complex component Sec8 n=1 Tax=Phytophthora oleae TaxID=2107226 RepID=A0ABD3EXL2_9STRA
MMMLSRLCKLRPVLDAFFEYLQEDSGVEEFSELTRTHLCQPTAEDWFMIQCLGELLAPFGALINEMRSSKHPSLVFALPGFRALTIMVQDKKILDHVSASVQGKEFEPRVRDMMLYVRQSFARLLEASCGDLSAEMSWISLLDPRFTDTELLTADEKRGAEERLVDEMFTTAKAARSSTTSNATANPRPVSEDSERLSKKIRTAYWERLYGGRSDAQ